MTMNYIVKELTQQDQVFDRAPDGGNGLCLAAGEKYDLLIALRLGISDVESAGICVGVFP